VQQFIGADSLKKGMVDGKVYAIAKKPQIPYNNIWIRKDWLDKLKLQPPTTLDELMQVATAFTEKDPDGNGKNDTYGLTGKKLSTFEPVLGAYGVGTPGSFYLKNGKLTSSFSDPNMKDALDYIKKMIDSGVVDPDILANTGNQDEKKAYQGKVGMIWTDFPKLTFENNVKEFKAVNPNAEWIQISPPKGPVGQFGGSYDIGNSPGMHGISKSVEKDPAKLNKIIEMLNYIASDEGATLVAHGEEGRHWNREGGKIVRTELRAKEHRWMYQLLGREDIEYLKSGYPIKDVELTAATKRIETLNGFLDLPQNYNSADATRYYSEELAKFVYGKRPLTEYNAFVQTLETTFKYKTLVDSATKQLTDLQIVK
jgi:putative aldouronate transport system substrate-binding protein